MITDTERIIIKRVLGIRYTNMVSKFLVEQKILSNKNAPYSKRMIQAVCQGTRENVQIENAIIQLCHQEKLKQKAIEEQRKKLMT